MEGVICKEYAHCTWTYYRTEMPKEEKLFWRYFLDAEWRRGEMRKTEAYKETHKSDASGSPLPVAAIDAPTIPDTD